MLSAVVATPAGDCLTAGEWVTLTETSRLTSASQYQVRSMALAGLIRVRTLPGTRTLYSRSDALRVAEALSESEAPAPIRSS